MINIDNYLRLNITDMILVFISTILMVLITKKFFWNYVKDYLDKREKLIQQELDSAKKKEEEGRKYLEEAEAKLIDVNKKAEEIMDKVSAESKKEAQKILTDARVEIERQKEIARNEIDKERIDAASQIKEEVGTLALMAAKKLLQKEIDDEVRKKYIQDFIGESGEAK